MYVEFTYFRQNYYLQKNGNLSNHKYFSCSGTSTWNVGTKIDKPMCRLWSSCIVSVIIYTADWRWNFPQFIQKTTLHRNLTWPHGLDKYVYKIYLKMPHYPIQVLLIIHTKSVLCRIRNKIAWLQCSVTFSIIIAWVVEWM
jgi:hypothetical protein